MRGNASGGAAHSFPEASTLPGVPQREGDSQRHLSGCFFFFSWSEEEELWDDWEEGGGRAGGVGGGAFTGVFGYTTGENDMGMFSVLL